MSEHSCESSDSRTQHSATELVERVFKRVGGECTELTLSAHLRACQHLTQLRDALLQGASLSKHAVARLRFAGISLHRRGSIDWRDKGGVELAMSSRKHAEMARDQTEAQALLRASATLVFLLLCLEAVGRETGETGDAFTRSAAARTALAEHADAPLWDVMEAGSAACGGGAPPTRKRKRGEGEAGAESDAAEADAAEADAAEADAAEAEAEAEAASGSRPPLCHTAEERAAHALAIGCAMISGEGHQLTTVAATFFRAAAASLSVHVLGLNDGDDDADFVALGAPPLAVAGVSRAERLAAIAAAAESEAGQQVARDLLLSFILPQRLVGTRQTLLLSRETSTAAGVSHAEATNRAHSVAMAGAEWIWAHGTDELERAVCLLTGVAILTTRGTEDPVRKADAFGGRVLAPFFETKPPPEPAMLRLMLIAERSAWVLFSLKPCGTPRVVSRLRGFEGLCDSCIRLVATL